MERWCHHRDNEWQKDWCLFHRPRNLAYGPGPPFWMIYRDIQWHWFPFLNVYPLEGRSPGSSTILNSCSWSHRALGEDRGETGDAFIDCSLVVSPLFLSILNTQLRHIWDPTCKRPKFPKAISGMGKETELLIWWAMNFFLISNRAQCRCARDHGCGKPPKGGQRLD